MTKEMRHFSSLLIQSSPLTYIWAHFKRERGLKGGTVPTWDRLMWSFSRCRTVSWGVPHDWEHPLLLYLCFLLPYLPSFILSTRARHFIYVLHVCAKDVYTQRLIIINSLNLPWGFAHWVSPLCLPEAAVALSSFHSTNSNQWTS